MSPDLLALRERLARLESGAGARAGASFPLGGAPGEADGLLALARGALHEVVAPGSADAAAAAGFALGLALRAAAGRPLLWARQDFIDGEAGLLSGMGLAAFGLDPAALVAVRARDATGVLRALAEGGRSPRWAPPSARSGAIRPCSTSPPAAGSASRPAARASP